MGLGDRDIGHGVLRAVSYPIAHNPHPISHIPYPVVLRKPTKTQNGPRSRAGRFVYQAMRY
jgi:hypothetical protein